MLGRIETRTRDRIYCQMIRTVRDISRDDRSRMATCSLRTPTDRLREKYSIDWSSMFPFPTLPHAATTYIYIMLLTSAGQFSGRAKLLRNVGLLQQTYFDFILHSPAVDFF